MSPFPRFKRPAEKQHDLTDDQKLCQAFGVPIRYAVHRGVITRLRGLDAHRRCCIQGYRAKGKLVAAGKGHNTLSGIPKEWTT